jgi:formyl-CoA transferase
VAPSAAYRCAGGGMNDYCYIRCETEGQWLALLAVIGHGDLAADGRFADSAARWRHRAAVDAVIESWTIGLGKHAVMSRLQAAGVTAAAILDTAELANDPFLRGRDVFVDIPHPVRETVSHVFWPVRLQRSRVALAPAPPRGRHNREVLAALLGFSDAQVRAVTPDDSGIPDWDQAGSPR